uniref:SRCR domain-containing protein n=1 Tax=Mesocestoides corti TaxID=53468 RepID=A0A5K3EM27_MESCO
MWGIGECRTEHFVNHQQCKTSQSCSVVWCGVVSGRRHIRPPGRSQSRVSLRSNGIRGR